MSNYWEMYRKEANVVSKKLKNVYADYTKYHEAWNLIRQSRKNEIIAAVNAKILKENMDFNNEAEAKYYEYLTAEADAYEEYGGVRPIFEMGEIDYDDPVLDIYNEPV